MAGFPQDYGLPRLRTALVKGIVEDSARKSNVGSEKNVVWKTYLQRELTFFWTFCEIFMAVTLAALSSSHKRDRLCIVTQCSLQGKEGSVWDLMYIMPVHHHIIYRIIYIYIINIIIPYIYYIYIDYLPLYISIYIYIFHIQVNLPPYFGQETRPKPQSTKRRTLWYLMQ